MLAKGLLVLHPSLCRYVDLIADMQVTEQSKKDDLEVQLSEGESMTRGKRLKGMCFCSACAGHQDALQKFSRKNGIISRPCKQPKVVIA